jgi:surfactin family lipopeptide synthetase A
MSIIREPRGSCHEPSPAEPALRVDRNNHKDYPTDSRLRELIEVSAEPMHNSLPDEARRNRLERLLAELWQQVLGIDKIGVHDNFFELGGDSITAALLLNQLTHRLGEAVQVVAMFDTPTIAGLAAYLDRHHATAVSRICGDEKKRCDEGSAEKIEATKVEQMKPIVSSPASFAAGGKDGSQAPPYTPIPPILGDGGMEVPLSFGQQRLWFLDQLQPGNPAYSSVLAIRIQGPLDLATLRNALEAIVTRHASLRTTFGIVDGSPIQLVKPQANATLSFEDLNALTESEREAAALRVAEQEAQRPFDLEHGPLFRATVLRLTETDHLLVLTIHHIVVDGWSIGVLIQELMALYPSFAAGESPSLPELPIQHADFAIWERQRLQGPLLEKLVSYWKHQLSGLPALLPLPTDHPRPAVETLRGAIQSFLLPKALSDALIALSRREGSTLFMTLLAAFQTLLHRYTSQTDILVGTPVANRTRREVESLIGFFVNTLVLRADLSGDPTFLELLARARDVALQGFTHQDLPFEKLVEELQPERDLSRNPLFQVMFILQNAPMPKLELDSLKASLVEVETHTAKFDLTLSMQETEQGLSGRIEYSCDLFDRETITRMVGHWQTLLEGIVADPGQRLSTLPLLTAAERRQLVEWNDTRDKDRPEQCIHQLLEEQVERTPEAVAVVYGDQQLTYRELNQRGNQLAHSLRKLGVGPEVRVGLCVERSLEMIVGMMGILKAGGAYVPLDPTYPRERLAFMLEDAQVPVLVTSKTASEWLPKGKAREISIDKHWEFISQENASNPVCTAGPDGLAYVIYTSGSTGRPKGVMVDHRNLVHATGARIKYYQDRSIRFLLLSSFAFDSSLAGIFWTLSQGGTLVLPQPGLERDLSRLSELIAQKQISHLLSLPSLYGLLLEHANPAQLRSLRRVIVAGEACSRELIARHSKQLPQTAVFNEYGPTEGTIWSSVHPCRSPVSKEQVPIGRPIANTQIYILDEHLQTVPIGVLGELHIGGAGVARGYLNQPEVTAEKFIPNPFAETPGARLYKTGDQARYLADGSIEFLGRLDEQVKIRGFRVELGEVEAVLAEHPGVKAAAIVLREDSPDEKRLMAFVTLRPGSAATAEELSSFLKQKLPEYMLPWKFEITDRLPLTPSGKIDRHRLRALSRIMWRSPKNEYSPPRTPLEKKLARIWSDVLKLERVGVRDNFFDLGGHSLLTVKLMAEIEKQTGKKLSLAGMFQAATIQDQAAVISFRSSPEEIPGVIPIQPKGSGPAFFCMGAGPLFRPLALRMGTEHPFLGLGLVESEILDLSAPFKLEDIAARLLLKLRALQPEGPYCLGGWCDDGILAYEVAQQLEAAGQRTVLVLFDAWNPALWRTNSGGKAFLTRFRNLGHHFSNLARLPLKKQWEYLGDTWNTQMRTLDNKLWRTRYNVMLRTTGKVPSGPPDFNKIEFVAVRNYEPKPFPGNVVLFCSGTEDRGDNHDSALGWDDLVPTGLEIHQVPGSHRGMFAEPNVEVLAKVLRTRLWEALTQEKAASRPARIPGLSA